MIDCFSNPALYATVGAGIMAIAVLGFSKAWKAKAKEQSALTTLQ